MSTGPEYPPTEPLGTEPIRPRTPVMRETAVAAEGVDPLWAARLSDQVRSLKSFLALMTIISLAALGLAVYSLVHNNDRNAQNAGQPRVSALDARLTRLESRTANTPDQSSISALSGRVDSKASKSELQSLSDDVRALKTSVAKAGSGDNATLTQLGIRVDRLAQQVDDLRSQSADTTTP